MAVIRCKRQWDLFHGFAMVETFVVTFADSIDLVLLLYSRQVCSPEEIILSLLSNSMTVMHTCLGLARLGLFRKLLHISEVIRIFLMFLCPIAYASLEGHSMMTACKAVWGLPSSDTSQITKVFWMHRDLYYIWYVQYL
jgi:hypothetical protein